MAVPVAVTVSAITILPPNINLLVEDGKLYPGVSISTGRGFGGDSNQITWFPDFRLQFELGEYFGRDRMTIVHAGALHDFIFGSVHPRNYFYLAAAGGVGVATDFRNVAPYVEGWFGVANPEGIRFITLFPMHNYGLRVRAGYDLTASRTQLEVAISATSTF
jgi:hypothetical protein